MRSAKEGNLQMYRRFRRAARLGVTACARIGQRRYLSNPPRGGGSYMAGRTSCAPRGDRRLHGGAQDRADQRRAGLARVSVQSGCWRSSANIIAAMARGMACCTKYAISHGDYRALVTKWQGRPRSRRRGRPLVRCGRKGSHRGGPQPFGLTSAPEYFRQRRLHAHRSAGPRGWPDAA